ncbi:hypothetical protein FKN01_31280 [Streptomyces sp. 130]|uniref:hypothetical protein n=1 Tax=Streptomyces sp. 130 TaxID=2591006 RepID=UPI00117DC46F|nr:hypothetical protein [Streptomyces sp. 130]TRV71769.1 hypothetical protein FKN01_31280 [Streptomyces sp. 130]
MSIVAEWQPAPLRAGLAEEIERQEREDDARGPEPEQRTVLAVVLERDGARCWCTGGCGTEPKGSSCAAELSYGVELIAAPIPLPLTEHEAAAVRVEDLHPWCVPCWNRARRRNTAAAAEARRRELAEAQMELFAPADAAGSGGGL